MIPVEKKTGENWMEWFLLLKHIRKKYLLPYKTMAKYLEVAPGTVKGWMAGKAPQKRWRTNHMGEKILHLMALANEWENMILQALAERRRTTRQLRYKVGLDYTLFNNLLEAMTERGLIQSNLTFSRVWSLTEKGREEAILRGLVKTTLTPTKGENCAPKLG